MVFQLDDPLDRDGRFGVAVTAAQDEFRWGDIAPVAFAATAWRIATDLDPPYVHRHKRILSAVGRANGWDGTLTAEVTIVAPWPAELSQTREWTHDRGWRDWPQTFGEYLIPSERDLTRAPHLRAQLIVEVPVPLDDLPPTPESPADGVAEAARRAVAVMARELSGILGPMLDQLDASHRP